MAVRLAALVLGVAFTSPGWSQTPIGGDSVGAAGREQATELERFESRTGRATVLGYTVLGVAGSVEVSAREYRDAGHPADVTAGLLLEVTQWYPSERSRASFVDEDEIDGLLRGIDYILQNATSEVTRFSNFEVRYRTKGGFGVAAFSSGETIGVVFQSGDVQYSFGRLVHLWQLRELIVRAQALLRKDA